METRHATRSLFLNTHSKQKHWICFVLGADPSHLAALSRSLPFTEEKNPSWIIRRILADGGKQKYRNDCAHCPPFEKRYPGKSSGEQKHTKMQDAAIIT